ncbi:MAG: hypothetical protein Q8O00_05125 [Holophaga sp.]|nr:hypothetical protein [Holophaga sp.]
MRALAATFLLLLLAGIACRRPVSILREKPIQGVQVFVESATLEPGSIKGESKADIATGTRLAQGLKAKLLGNDPVPGRTLRVQVESLRRNPYQSRGLFASWMLDLGGGAAVGALIGSGAGFGFTSLEITAAGAGVGTIVGFFHGPVHFKANREFIKNMGYLPWNLRGKWLVEEWIPPAPPKELASGILPVLDLRPFLTRLSPEELSDDSKVRKECLRAYEDALLDHLFKKGVRVDFVAQPPQP